MREDLFFCSCKNAMFSLYLQRPPSSSLSFTANDDVRSPPPGGTPGPLSQPPNSAHSTDNSEAGKIDYVTMYKIFSFIHTHMIHCTRVFSIISQNFFIKTYMYIQQNCKCLQRYLLPMYYRLVLVRQTTRRTTLH